MKTVIANENRCFGCRACEEICPQKAILMEANQEGFLVPTILAEKCIDCKKCLKVCPAQNGLNVTLMPKRAYAAINKDIVTLMDSSSGGAFTAIAESVLEENGVVIACAFNNEMKAQHMVIEDKLFLPRFRGSKYVQSDTLDTYQKTREMMEIGRLVLYVGTPCQIAGLKSYLQADYENLLTIDLVCHGVPSPALFSEHIKWLESKRNKHIIDYRFRTKIIFTQPYYYSYHCQGTTKLFQGGAVLDPYYAAFLQAKTYRECCYQCPFSKIERPGDFTIADYWHAAKFHPQFSDTDRVSIVLVNTELALALVSKISEKMDLTITQVTWVKQINYNLNQPATRPNSRDEIYSNIQQNGYAAWANRYCSTPRHKMMRLYYTLPSSWRRRLKKMHHK